MNTNNRDSEAKAEFEQTIKTPRHFPGVRKELAKLYALHFTKVPLKADCWMGWAGDKSKSIALTS